MVSVGVLEQLEEVKTPMRKRFFWNVGCLDSVFYVKQCWQSEYLLKTNNLIGLAFNAKYSQAVLIMSYYLV